MVEPVGWGQASEAGGQVCEAGEVVKVGAKLQQRRHVRQWMQSLDQGGGLPQLGGLR